MKQPTSNGLFEVTGGKDKERGFCCMKLITFLTTDNVTTWNEWHGAHLAAAAGKCPYTSRCPIYARTIANGGKRPVQLSLF